MLDARLIESDAYDREAFARASEALADGELKERGSRLLAHFEALVEDLFAAAFKLVVRVRSVDEAPASTLLNRRLLQALIASPEFCALKEETALDAARAAHAARTLAGRIVALIRNGDLLLEEELLQARELAEEEERGERMRSAARDLAAESPEASRDLAEEAESAERRARRLAREVGRSAEELPPRLDAALASTATRLAERLPGLEESADAAARSLGAGAVPGAEQRLRLAERLEASEKLRKLAALAGAFRADARAARRRNRERAATELYRVGQGAEIGRLLPSELVALRQPLRRRDLMRRMLEGALAQYELRGDDRHGRGPIVVCIDGSGSMSGPRELWAKAVALALVDIARRQRRHARAIVFSGPEAPLSSFELARGGRAIRSGALESFVALAECFPGGGTDFEKPLRAALEATREKGLRGADVVFVTDGEAKLSELFVEELRAEKRRLDLNVVAVLVDDPAGARNVVASGERTARAASELGKIADRLTTVTELTSAAAMDLLKGL